MKIICCKCKKEYSLEDNIHKCDKANRPILICPYCRFKHIIDFIPFEGKIKTKKIKKLNLKYWPVTVGATRYADADRVDYSGIDDGDAKGKRNWIYDSKSLDIGAQGSRPYGVSMSPDGTRMLTVGTDCDMVKQWNLSTAWDITTAVYSGKYIDISPKGGMPIGVRWGDSGNKVYVLEVQIGRIHQYNCPTAYNLTGATYGTYFVTGVEDAAPKGITLSYDGSKLYIMGCQNDYIYQYTLSTPWTISSTTYDNKKLYVGEVDIYGIHISDDGYRMYAVGAVDDMVYKYILGTAHDISTGVLESQYEITQDNYPRDISISPDESKMYVMGNGNRYIYQYIITLSGDWDRDNDFILATRIWGSKGPHVQAFKLRWRKLLGTWVDVGNTGAITYNATTILVDGNAVIIGERLCDEESGYDWQDGEESEGDNILPDSGTYSLADEYYTELQWALNCSNAEGGATYEFELWDTTEGTSLGICVAQLNIKAERDATGKASITSNLTANVQVTSGGPKNRTGKASLTSSIISILSRGKIEGATAKASIISSVIALLKKESKDATGKASLITTLTAVLSRGKIENAIAKADIITNMTSILSRGKIEDRTGKVEITTLMQAILSNFINTTGKASINTNIDITLSRGKIENVTGKADISSSIISILSKGRIENVTGKADITSNMDSILSKGKIENVTGKSDITTSMSISLLRGKIESVIGKSSIISNINIVLSKGKIEDVSGKVDITSDITVTLNRGKIENVSGVASITTSVISLLSVGKIKNVSGKSQIETNIDITLKRIISVNAKATLETLCNAILSKGEIINVNGKVFIYTSISSKISRKKNVIGKVDINSLINIDLKRILNVTGKSIFDTLIEIEVSETFAFTQMRTMGITFCDASISIKENDSKLDIINITAKPGIKE